MHVIDVKKSPKLAPANFDAFVTVLGRDRVLNIRGEQKDDKGNVTNWMVECGSPNIMLRRGFTKHSLEVGTEVSVKGYQAKNGTNRANGSSVTFKDGHKLFVGGSNPDLPDDKK